MSLLCFLPFLVLVTSAFFVEDTMTMEEKLALYQSVEKNLHGCALHVFPGERGMSIVALKDIKFNEPYLAIPAELTISSFDSFEWHPYLKDGGPELRLITRLIYEKYVNKRGAWTTEYIHALPTFIDAVLNWTEPEKKELFDHAFHKFSIEMPLPFEAGFAKVSQILARVPGIYSICPHCLYPEVYAWAYLNMFARAFKQTLASWKQVKGYSWQKPDETVEGAAMYPILDLVNHGPTPKRFADTPDFYTIRTQTGKMPAFVMFADRNFPKHSELVWEYGKKTNLELIYGYGFLLDKNPHDVFMYDITTTRYCLGSRLQNDICRFKIGSYQHNDELLNMLRQAVLKVDYTLSSANNTIEYFDGLSEDSEPETRGNFIEAVRRYRQGLNEYQEGIAKVWSLRAERRGLAEVSDGRKRAAFRFGIAEKVLLYEHLKIIDRLAMKLVWRSLDSPK